MRQDETRKGFVILDGRGRLWDRQLYATKAAAEATASACVCGRFSISAAKEILRFQRMNSIEVRPVAELVVET